MIGADSSGHVGEGNRGDENVMGMWWKAYPRERMVIGADSNGHVGEGNRGDENVMGMWWKAYPRGENGDRGRLQWTCWRREQR